jgi:hypothetical protein
MDFYAWNRLSALKKRSFPNVLANPHLPFSGGEGYIWPVGGGGFSVATSGSGSKRGMDGNMSQCHRVASGFVTDQ